MSRVMMIPMGPRCAPRTGLRRAMVLGLVCGGLLAGCGSDATGPREPSVGGAMVEGLLSLTRPKTAPLSAAALRPQITPALLAQLQGAVILTEINGAGAVMVEDGRNKDMVSYVDSGRIGLSLVDGIVVGTRGLGDDLMTADISEIRAVLRSGGSAKRVHRRMTALNRIAVTGFECELVRDGSTVTETCYGPSAKFENTYVLDGADDIAASRQWLGSTSGYVTITRIR